jgi:hypothetical protein
MAREIKTYQDNQEKSRDIKRYKEILGDKQRKREIRDEEG